MKEFKITIRLHKSQMQTLKEIAEYLGMNYSECVRNSLRFGLNALVKFETNGKMDLKKMASASPKTPANGRNQENDKPKEPPKQEEPKSINDLRKMMSELREYEQKGKK